MVKIRLHGGFFVARLFPFKCCRRFTSFAICLPYPFGAGNCNTVLPRFLAFSGFITVKSQRCAFPFDNMQPLRCNSKRVISDFLLLTTKNFYTTSAVYAICAIVGYFLSIWQNCNADAEKFCLQCLQCKREKLQISAQRQPCTQFVQPLGVFCQFGKIAMQMRKNFVCDVCRAREKNHKIPLSWRLFA